MYDTSVTVIDLPIDRKVVYQQIIYNAPALMLDIVNESVKFHPVYRLEYTVFTCNN
jgi:hypothetical protein